MQQKEMFIMQWQNQSMPDVLDIFFRYFVGVHAIFCQESAIAIVCIISTYDDKDKPRSWMKGKKNIFFCFLNPWNVVEYASPRRWRPKGAVCVVFLFFSELLRQLALCLGCLFCCMWEKNGGREHKNPTLTCTMHKQNRGTTPLQGPKAQPSTHLQRRWQAQWEAPEWLSNLSPRLPKVWSNSDQGDQETPVAQGHQENTLKKGGGAKGLPKRQK